MRRTTILVADPSALFRCGVRAVLARESDLEIVEAGGREQLLRKATEACPDVALIDLELPPGGALAAIALLSEHCTCQVVVWSFDPPAERVLEAIRAGADGYLDKTITGSGLVRALRGMERGEAALGRELTAKMVEALHGQDASAIARARAAALSIREREVLELVAQGARNKQIAVQLLISEFTVKRHVQNILQKLEVSSRRAAATFVGAKEAV